MILQIQPLKELLDKKYHQFNRIEFIDLDPVSIPHLFSKREDIEISGFWSAILSWGQRATILNKSKLLISLMDYSPYDFILQHKENDLKPFEKFKHRTFNSTDALYFIKALRRIYLQYGSLEYAFSVHLEKDAEHVGKGIAGFEHVFFDDANHPPRTKKHVSTPKRNSACKRLNMFLRWMVRRDEFGVDFGIWHSIKPSQLVCPCDVHVERVARMLGLIEAKTINWNAAVELTHNLKKFDKEDPVKYDFALFGMGMEEKEKLAY